jgi:hypothetical protein
MRGTGNHKPPEYMQPCPMDNTSEFIVRQVDHWIKRPYFTEIIHTEVAREIASWWADGGVRGIQFAAFASTGTILDKDDFLAAIRFEIIDQLGHSSCLVFDNIKALMALDHYVRCID